ncbi:V-type proton ATPase subunit F-like [Homalodisca vitripennis]|uniref:V-type proton ATPase subunit F-like n=1 Tax=Homalodisca vitripennis TaxID=197043 RepID=UPI001EEC8C33|nr:V-type proton ATPase subunit F-like [Homalodisca vitripennis]KAG8313627.1 V-type proton ATPase subunit F [Homalodisca vitripennis]
MYHHHKQSLGATPGKLIAVIGDEDTCVGFLLGGLGEINKSRQPNFLVVNKNTNITDIEETFRLFTKRDDIGIILINQNVADLIRNSIVTYHQNIPTVLEIPSKDLPYDHRKDFIFNRAKGMFNPDDINF